MSSTDHTTHLPAPIPTSWKDKTPHMCRVYHSGKPGVVGDGTRYTSAKDGALVRLDSKGPSKKERNRRKREARAE